jgi:hypothetical protein
MVLYDELGRVAIIDLKLGVATSNSKNIQEQRDYYHVNYVIVSLIYIIPKITI